MVKQWVEVPESASEDRTQQWTMEHIVGIPVPQVVEELVEVPKEFAQDRLRQRSEEQTIETPDISLKEKIVEKPVIQMQGNTQQVVNIYALFRRTFVTKASASRMTYISAENTR